MMLTLESREDLELKCHQLFGSCIELIGSGWKKEKEKKGKRKKERFSSHALFHKGIRSTMIINIANDRKSLGVALCN